jgi:hypothetical protein
VQPYACGPGLSLAPTGAGRGVKAIQDHSTNVKRPTDRQARELAPLAKTQPQEAVRGWREAVEWASAEFRTGAGSLRGSGPLKFKPQSVDNFQ